jgi:two-component system chemotaxis response regulator CheB
MSRVRTLVVEDSMTVRRVLCDVLNADPEIEVVGEAGDGATAITLCERLRPDVITLDMMLPVLTGLEATEHIMANCPTPILIVSASTNRGELFQTYDALAAGAVDVLEKPRGDSNGEWEEQFCRAVKIVSRVRVVTHRPRRRPAPPLSPVPPSPGAIDVLAIGASTGGPSAIVQVLRAVPAPSPVPILVVLHIATAFGSAFAEWLDGQTPHRVALARDGASLESGVVVMAPPGRHLIVRGGRVRLDDGPERHSCKPSIDVCFDSLAIAFGPRVAACLLTGMGRDGAAGLLALRRAGATTIAQDEATCVVYGMPREAALLGAARHVLGVHEIGPSLTDLLRAPRGER